MGISTSISRKQEKMHSSKMLLCSNPSPEYIYPSVVNGFPVSGICFVFVEKTKSAKNIWELVIEDVIILGFLLAYTSSKRQKIYIFCTICYIFTL